MQQLLLITLLSFTTVTYAQDTLDEVISPQELAEELSLIDTETINAPSPQKVLTPQESEKYYGKNWNEEFPLIYLINKAQVGPTAQRMIVYKNGKRAAIYPISTGREKWENPKSGRRYFSRTPTGWFTPTRMVKNYFSRTWQSPMDFSIFFIDGVATHAAAKEYEKKLGTRASGGCVRLIRDQAKTIFYDSQSAGRGPVLQFDRSGRPQKTQSQKSRTLIVVVDRPNE